MFQNCVEKWEIFVMLEFKSKHAEDIYKKKKDSVLCPNLATINLQNNFQFFK